MKQAIKIQLAYAKEKHINVADIEQYWLNGLMSDSEAYNRLAVAITRPRNML